MRSFIHTAKERRGITYLLVIVCLLIGTYLVMPYVVPTTEFDYAAFEDEINRYKRINAGSEEEIVEIEIPDFNINEVSAAALNRYGLGDGVAQRWIKYRDAIGGFDSIAQIRKIYGLDEEWYQNNKDKLQITRSLIPANDDLPKVQLFSFDPNIVTKQEMQQLGFSEMSMQALENYRAKGGTFYRKEELKYLKGMHPNNFKKLSRYISIDSSVFPKIMKEEKIDTPILASVEIGARKVESESMDINTSNVYQWQMLKGIGPKYAQRIVHFRNKLGGFTHIGQVGETHYLPDSVFQSIKPYLKESTIFKPLEINLLSADSLRLHPYIDWKQASIMVNYRKQHGDYQSANDLYKIRVFDTIFVERIRPYLTF